MPDIKSIRLSELTSTIQSTLNTEFENKTYWVIADITNHSFYAKNGNHYFELVEKQEGTSTILAKISAVVLAASGQKIKNFEQVTGQKFTNDINVLLKVYVDYNATFGLKLYVHDIDANFTIGTIEQQKQNTLKRLLTECSGFISHIGDLYLTANSKLVLNPVMQRLAVVSSSNSAGYQDFMHTIENNSWGYKFLIDNYFTVVQGENNADQIRKTLLDVFNSKKPYDAVVIIRGGGAQTDFLIFDTFDLGKIVAKFPIPIITGIGHQKNETIVDLMANVNTKTPTKAAEFIIAHNRFFEEDIFYVEKSIIIKSQQHLSAQAKQLNTLNTSITGKARLVIQKHTNDITNINQRCANAAKTSIFNNHRNLDLIVNKIVLKPSGILSTKKNELENLVSNIISHSKKYILNKNNHVGHYISVFKLLNPVNIIRRGFAIIYHKGKIIRNLDNVKVGDDITILQSDTKILSTIKSKTKSDGTGNNL